jgi:hypothetical protein
MNADPTMPLMYLTPSKRKASTNASLPVILLAMMRLPVVI